MYSAMSFRAYVISNVSSEAKMGFGYFIPCRR